MIGSGNQTLDPQKDHAARPGNRTLDPQKRSRARPGVRTLDRLKRLFVRSGTRSLNAIAHAIVKFHVRKKYAQVHERVPRGTCPLDDGRRPDRPKNGRRTDRFKNDESFEKICSLQTYLFQGTTSCTKLRTFLQAESAFNNTYVEYVPQNVHRAKLHDQCMISVFCLQFIFVDN